MDTESPQRIGVAVDAMPPRGEADHPRTRGKSAGGTHFGILENDAVGDANAELAGSVQIDVRCRLAAFDMLAAAVDVAAKFIGETKMRQMRKDPARRAR